MATTTPEHPDVRARRRPTQVQFATVFSARMAASHGLNTYLVWLAFTSKSASTAGWVLVARALAALLVPLVVGRLHDRGAIGPWLRVCAVVEAAGAVTLAWVGWHGASAWVMIALSLLLGSTSSLFDTVVYPLLLTGTPSRLRPHVLVGLSYDVAKVVGSSIVLALLAVWHSPWPVMCVSLLSLAGWRLSAPRVDEPSSAPAPAGPSVWRVMDLGPVMAIATVSLLPGQVTVFQVVAADHSFGRFGLLGTAFAVGAVVGNMVLQRLPVSHRNASLAYLATAAALVCAMAAPVVAFVAYGVSVAIYYQLTRVLVIEAAAPELRGRVSAAMTASTKVVAVFGGVFGAAMVHRPVALHVTAAVIAVVCAGAVGFQRRAASLATLAG